MELGISKFWGTLGYFWDSCYFAVQLVEWVREAFFGYLEHGAYLFDVDYLEGTQSTYV